MVGARVRHLGLTAKHNLPPHQVFLGEPYGNTADVHSVALVTWHMLALRAPYDAYDEKAWVARVCRNSERPPLPRAWPTVVREALAAAWDRAPGARSSAVALATALSRGSGEAASQ